MSVKSKVLTVKDIISMGTNLVTSPKYQRREVWTSKHTKDFISHICTHGSSTSITLRDIGEGKYEVMDGQQRVVGVQKLFGVHPSSVVPFHKGLLVNGECVGNMVLSSVSKSTIKYVESLTFLAAIHNRISNEEAIEIFLDMQKGVRLTAAERVFAMDTYISDVARDIANHPFFSGLYWVKRNNRFTIEKLITILMFIEKEPGRKTINEGALSDFCKKYKEKGSYPDNYIQRIKSILDVLESIFGRGKTKDTKLSQINVLNTYMITRYVDGKYLDLSRVTEKIELKRWIFENLEEINRWLKENYMSSIQSKPHERRGFLIEYVDRSVLASTQ